MSAYARGAADRRRGRAWKGARRGKDSCYPGNFGAPLRRAYNAGWEWQAERR